MHSETSEGKRILVIDDERAILDLLQRRLTASGYVCEIESDGLRAIQRIKAGQFDLLITDVNMPYINGTELLAYTTQYDSEIPVIMISGMESIDLVRKTLREGASDYLVKPLDLEELELSIENALEIGRMKRQLRQYQENLERQVAERTRSLADALSRIEGTYNATILALGSALETRDIETNIHGLRVAFYSQQLSLKLGVTDSEQLKNIERGAYLHDIGKIGVPDAILLKPMELTDEEWVIMRRHPEIGRNIIEGIEFLKGAVPIVYSHHEYFDGSGYPQGLAGDQIPFEARIFSVADALDALVSDRPYRKSIPLDEAKDIIRDGSGTQFDPDVVVALDAIDDSTLVKFESLPEAGISLFTSVRA